jgi:hypothetical protein
MKRAFAFVAVTAWIVVLILLHSAIKDFLWIHPWWHGFLAAVPGIAVPILAYFELRHSAETNTLRTQANEYRAQANNLQAEIAEIQGERNALLQQIARGVEKPITEAQRNAEILRGHLREKVVVLEGNGSWAFTPEIVGVDDDVVTLFQPRDRSSSQAWSQKVRCDRLVITEIQRGDCHLQLDVLERHGNPIDRGEITRWEDRFQPEAIPAFTKGSLAYQATFSKPGSDERRTLSVFPSHDGSNSFLLEASTGKSAVADNKEISKLFMNFQIEYEAAGFVRSGSSTGETQYRLYIH